MNNPSSHTNTDEYSGPLSKYAPPREKTYESVMDQVMDGHRFVTIPFVVSIVILTLQRQMGGLHVVRTGEFPGGKMIAAALITMLFGWWGVPFGIFFSLITFFHLFKGGRDVTFEILENAVGREEAKRILKNAPKPKLPPSIWIVRAIIIAPFALVGLVIFQAINTP